MFKMEIKSSILAIAEQLINDSEESDHDIDSDLEYSYAEEEFLLSVTIEEKKKTLRQLIEESGLSESESAQKTQKLIGGISRDQFRERYSEKVARTMDDTTFKTHFGMTRQTFRVVLEHLQGRVAEKYVDLDTQLMCTLWLLATQDSYRSTAERFKLSKGTVHFVVMRLCKELAALADRFVCWPSSADRHVSAAARFRDKAGFPGVVGCVDHTCVPVKEPSHADHKKSGAGGAHVQVQGVCDADRKFMFVSMLNGGCGQSVQLDKKLVRLVEELGNQHHILGDGKYPLERGLMTPFEGSDGDDDNLLEWQRKYNEVHRATHAQIGFAFAQLKLRFWRVKCLDMALRRDKVREVLLACCVLHNICLDLEGPLEDMTQEEMTELLQEDSHSHGSGHQHPQPQPGSGTGAAAAKRDRIAHRLR